MERLTLGERLRPLPIEVRQLLRRAENARIRQADARVELENEQMLIRTLVRMLRHQGVPAKTIALALGVSKTWVVRCGS
jgi:hypothetical protein